MSLVSTKEVERLLDDRPAKFNGDEVGYEAAPEGSAIRCASCHHLYRRATDGFGVCELFRDEQTDQEGINPGFRCAFWSSDGAVRPLLPEPEPEEES